MIGDEIEHGLGEALKRDAKPWRAGEFYHLRQPGTLMRHTPWLPALLALAIALLGVAHAPNSAAQDLLRADVAAQPLIPANAGTLRGCGLRLFAAHIASDRWIVAIETSVGVYVDGTAAFNGEVSEFSAPIPGRRANPAPVAIESLWVKSPDIDATMPGLGKAAKGEDGYSLAYAITAESAIAVMSSAMKGESILFGFRRTGKPAEQLYVGAPKPTRDESEQLQRCISDLIR